MRAILQQGNAAPKSCGGKEFFDNLANEVDGIHHVLQTWFAIETSFLRKRLITQVKGSGGGERVQFAAAEVSVRI
ncbi:hypothetical protein DSM3645_08051 [Blastopirellula marina DSM 3645]|uniref:Uncharacterized protein n=1 Tax=Blastopirellula marina DSM 3645 TaxID=314230 RepID=A4A0X9_9BACT|nr:hypothetical protein DSM3645_08051 [Blastopirellula marina DSM 3645]